jgi:hypothetical protein
LSVVYQFNESISQEQKTAPTRKSNLSINIKKSEPNQQNLNVDSSTSNLAGPSNRTPLKKIPKLKRDQKENTPGNSQQFQTSSRNKKLDRLNYMSGIDILHAYKLKYKDNLINKLKPNIEQKRNPTVLGLYESQISKSDLFLNFI